MTFAILLAIWLMFAIELFRHAPGHDAILLNMGALPTAGIAHHQYWRLLSYALLHDGWAHIGVNTYLLVLSGPLVERSIGSGSTLILALGGVVVGGLAILLAHHGHAGSIELGASAGLFALMAAGLSITWRAGAAFKVLAASVVLGLAASLLPGISMAAHLGGLFTGLVYMRALGLRGSQAV